MIEARSLSKRFGPTAGIREVSLRVARGELYALLGGNGAGKTTTLHLLLGLIAADAGEALIDGEWVGPGRRARAAFVPEVVELYPELTPLETLELFAAVAERAQDRGALEAALETAGLAPELHRRPVRAFSKGMRQKVALAAAAVQGAKAILLDEPTSGLDPAAAEQLMLRLAALKAAGAAILMSTHDILLVSRVADRVGILREGRLVEEHPAAGLDGAALLELYRTAMAA